MATTKGTTKGKGSAAKDDAPVIPEGLLFTTAGVYDPRSPDFIHMAGQCPMLEDVSGVIAINEKRVTKALRRVENPIRAEVYTDAAAYESDQPLIKVSYVVTQPSGKGTAGKKPGNGRKWTIHYQLDGETVEETKETPVRQWKYKRDEVQLDVWDRVRECLAKIYPSLVTLQNVATPEEAEAAAEIAELQAKVKAKKASLKSMKDARLGKA